MNNYLLSIGCKENDYIVFFDLYNNIEKTQYNGAFKIKDRFFKTTQENFIKYQKEFCILIFPISKEKFNFFLNCYYDDFREMKLNEFLIKYGLEEHGI
jgi:hypothetical protein